MQIMVSLLFPCIFFRHCVQFSSGVAGDFLISHSVFNSFAEFIMGVIKNTSQNIPRTEVSFICLSITVIVAASFLLFIAIFSMALLNVGVEKKNVKSL